jgi:hypothetical protein
VAWCAYLQGHARRLYASVTDQARVAAALLAAKLTHGRLPSPFTARDVYRNEWTGLAEPGSYKARSPASRSWDGCGRKRSGSVTTGGPPCGSASTRGSWRAGMTNRDDAFFPRLPDAPDVAPVANGPTEVLSVWSGTRYPA